MPKKRDEKALDFSDKYIRWFSELGKGDIKVAGGKGANLGEMFNNKFPVPPGFVITAQAFEFLIEKSKLKEKIKSMIIGIDFDDTAELEKKAKEIRELIISQEIPEELKQEILEDYHILSTEQINEKGISEDALNILKNSRAPAFVSVRSSATTEDLSTASFAGQQQSFLNIKGDSDLIEHVKKCFASLYTARALYYRNKKGFSEEEALLAVVIQKMVDSEKSGVAFSKDPMNLSDNIVIEAVFGLGEGIVSGKIHPDHYIVSGVSSEDLKVKNIKVTDKKIAIVRKGSGENQTVKLSPDKSKQQVLTKAQIIETADYSLRLEQHYQKPQDVEFAIEQGRIYIVQSRPITTAKTEKQEGTLSGNIIVQGLGASPGVGVGNVKLIKTMADLSEIKKGDVLVTKMTNPDMVVSMQKSVGIVTDEGGMTAHASIVSREMGIPCVVGTGDATSILKDGMKITVDGTNGKIYEGQVAETRFAEVKPIVETKTKLKLILDLPEFAERATESKIDSIGLLRLEGIIASSGKHPLLHEKENTLQEYTELLKKGIEKISKPFNSIWIRSSDLRTDEYGSLKGAPEEEINPMLGFHGIRFSLKFPKIFEAELQAIKQVAQENPDKKFGVMFPQIISLNELKQAKEIYNKFKTENMEIGVMVETPASVQIIDELCPEVDFISFGTNDLTQYTLAVDRGEDRVQELYDEIHPAVFSQIKKVLDACKRTKTESSICGQAGSRKEMVEFLLKQGINSISVNADAAQEISKFVKELEEKIETGFDTRRQEGMIKKEELKIERKEPEKEPESIIEEQKPKDLKIIICADCKKETKLPFTPRGDGPFYCKKCFKHRKGTKVPLTSQPSLKTIEPIDTKEQIKEKIEDIQEQVEEEKQERIEQAKEVEESIETEISETVEEIQEPISEPEPVEGEEQGITSEPANPEDVGVYNPEQPDNKPPAYSYAFDDDNEFSDVF